MATRIAITNENEDDFKDVSLEGLDIEQTRYVHALENEVSLLTHHLDDIRNNLAKWMLSQKAFKELAIQLGEKQGISLEEIMEKTIELKLDVLENRNVQSHGTNAKDSIFLKYKAEELKQDIVED